MSCQAIKSVSAGMIWMRKSSSIRAKFFISPSIAAVAPSTAIESAIAICWVYHVSIKKRKAIHFFVIIMLGQMDTSLLKGIMEIVLGLCK